MKHPCADLAGDLLCLAACCALLTSCGDTASAPSADFVRVEEGRFLLGDEPCYFVGTNFWYGPILGSEGPGGDRARLGRELDTLAACGLRNLRVLVGAEGPEGVPSKIAPILQPAPGRYDNALLDGLDYFMQQLALRGMKAVLYLTNSWEWSGGYSQYLAWAGAGEAAIPAVDGYRAYVDYVSQFIPNARARALYADHVRFIVGRTNRYTGVRYADDPTIFSWQICNEPRPFGEENHEAFAEWIGETARLIRSLDPNHLISTGSEGIVGCEGNEALTERIHAFPEIDYINIHIWPSNWQWVDKEHLAEGIDNALALTDRYIDQHMAIAERLRKPVVIEEFGFPRDDCRFGRGTPTTLRDRYYAALLERLQASATEGGLLAGVNCWAWGGEAQPAHRDWQPGDPYCGDPAQEPQGLYSVFGDDTTVTLLREAAQRLAR